ncbi:acyl-CoA thioesterase II [Tepidamorphus sp. 3E244]|uniref:acyl-CoA thioesterase II n=1 Tax=Tepidamorphus sp. 3E244 TaxID=3385498 RepID=UPI0038FCF823
MSTPDKPANKSTPIEKLVANLELEQIEVNLFRGESIPTDWKRVYGGQVIAQALMAAARTVEGRPVHSLHAYFILPGDTEAPIIYDVERIRDGGSFTTRVVKAIQHGRAIFSMSASFHAQEPGAFDHQFPMPDVPMPEDLPSEAEMREQLSDSAPEAVRRYWSRKRAIEMRPTSLSDSLDRTPSTEPRHVWVNASGRLPDDPVYHQCLLAYASDAWLLDTSLVPHGRSVFDPQIQAASLDHALWFHRPFRADEWLLYTQDSPSAMAARGFNRGSIYSRDGVLVASVAQEGLIRLRKD